MRFFIFAGILLSALYIPAQNRPSRDVQRLTTLLRKERVIHFRLAEIYDPYQGGQRMAQRSVKNRYLSLSSNKHFALHHEGSKQLGRWDLQGEDIAFRLAKQATTGGGKSSATLMELVSFNGRRLSLRRQGRHGYITYVYLLVRQPKDPS